jgi:hypothetical protein
MSNENYTLDLYEASEIVGHGPGTIREYARIKKIKGKKVNDQWRFRREDLLAYVDARSKKKLKNF